MIHNKFRYLLTLVALFAISTGAWAAGTVYNTTVALNDLKAGDVLTDGFKLTTKKGQYIYVKGYKKDGGTAETGDYTQLNAYNSTFPAGVTISESGSTYTPYADGKDANAWIVSDCQSLGSATMLYLDGYNYTAAPITVEWNASTKTGTFDMPGSDVVLTPEYYPGMLTLPASLTGGKLEVVGMTAPFTKLEVLDAWENDNTLLSAAHLPGLKEMTDAEAENWTDVPNGYVILIYGFDGTKAKMATYIDGELTFPSTEDVTLSQLKTASADAELYYSSEAQMPVGFEKDEEGNIYVADKTEFQVKAVPAEGYRLASLMFGETDVTDQVDADGIATLTMPEGNADITLTATFSNEYTVALNAEGLSDEEAANWKAATGDNDPAAFPLENVKYGTEVKVTYTGTKKVIGVKAEKKAKAATLADALVDGATVVIAFSYGYLSTNTFTNNKGTFTLTDATGFGAADDETTQLTADGSNLIFKANWDTSIDKNWSNLGFQVTIDTTDNTYVVWKSDTAIGYSAKFTSITVNGTEIQLTEMK